MRELARRAAQLGVPPSHLTPRVLLTLEVRLRRVLDLTDTDERARWGLDQESLGGEYEPCQEVAAAARRDGYEAVRYPSATGKGVNLAVFLDRLHPGSSVHVLDLREIGDAELPG